MNRRDAIAALTALPGLARIDVARLKPGDVLVLEVDQHISQETADRLKASLESVWPDHKVVVLCGAMRLKVMEQ